MRKGLVHIYYGGGKGKTTAAVGLAVRAAGDSKRVLFVQFLKGLPSGEVAILNQLPHTTVLQSELLTKFFWDMTEDEKVQAQKINTSLFKKACDTTAVETYDLLIFDEILDVCNLRLLNEAELLLFIDNKPQGLELVLTGRDPSKDMLERADYVTEMHKVKHPFDKGIAARKGVEY